MRRDGAGPRLLIMLLVSAALATACSSGSKGKSAAPLPSATGTSAATRSPSTGPTKSPSTTASPSSTGHSTPAATPTPCHARVGSCLTVRSNGDAVNVRKAPNTRATIVRTISSGYQVEVLCVGKGVAVAGPSGPSSYWDAVDGGWISDAYVGAAGHVKACR